MAANRTTQIIIEADAKANPQREALLEQTLATADGVVDLLRAVERWQKNLKPELENTPFASMLAEISGSKLNNILKELYQIGTDISSCSDFDLASHGV